MGYILHSGDAVEWARNYSGPLFHALLTDAPYEMGFMGREWDNSGVAFDPETWRAFARVLHPGAFLFVSAGTINDDLISVAMREARLRKFHKMMGWAYGSGFPKASRIDTQIDKAAGAEREVVGEWNMPGRGSRSPVQKYGLTNDSGIVTKPSTPLAQAWEAHRYGLQALKPAIETILVFQKPYEGKPIDNITETGAGALNIDGGRIGTDVIINSPAASLGNGITMDGGRAQEGRESTIALGRWPSNFLLLGPEAARALDEQSGELGLSKGGYRGSGDRSEKAGVWGMKEDPDKIPTGFGDSGGASRFFFRVSDQIDEADPVYYSAKASRREREEGLDQFEARDVAYKEYRDAMEETDSFVSKYPDGSPRPMNKIKNPHPTVKPLSLCQYLATLLLPPPEYAPRRIFVPFAGVASEMIGAMMAGWEEIEGVELTEEYIPIASARLSYWQGKSLSKSNGSKKAKPAQVEANQMELI